ncbi:MAG: hypothetical protein V4864_25715 [Pseudomonadota bacterium]
MGFFMKEHDVYVGTMLDELNLRFAPAQGTKEHFGGIQEMVELQKEFQIFKEGRSLSTSVTALHLGGSANHEVKNRFYRYLTNLRRQKSNVPGQNGDAAIVGALIRNLSAKKPLPVHFGYHDMRGDGEHKGVIIRDKARPLFYLEQDYLSVSLPMQPQSAAEAKKLVAAPAAGKADATAAKAKKKPAKKK